MLFLSNEMKLCRKSSSVLVDINVNKPLLQYVTGWWGEYRCEGIVADFPLMFEYYGKNIEITRVE